MTETPRRPLRDPHGPQSRFRRYAPTAAVLVGTVILATGLVRLRFDDSYRVFFSERNPELAAYDAFERRFGHIDNMLFAVLPDEGDVFQPPLLSAIAELTEEAGALPYATRVVSIANHLQPRSEGDDLVVEPALSDLAEPEAVAVARGRLLSDGAVLNRLINGDGTAAGVHVSFQLPRESSGEESTVLEAGRELADRIENEYPGVRVRLTGTILVNASFKEAALQDLATLGPVMFAGIALTAWLMLRNLAATAATALVVGLSVAAAMGALGWSGVPLTAPASSAPVMILTLAVADCIHIAKTALHGAARGLPQAEAVAASLRANGRAVFLTSATTVLGFLTLNLSDVPPLRHLGNVTAIGVAVAYLLSVALLPALLVAFPARAGRDARPGRRFDPLANLLVARPGALLVVSTAVTFALASGLPRNVLDDPFVKYFGPAMTFRQDTDVIMERLTGMYRIHFGVESGEPGGAADPAYLNRLDAFAEWCRAQPHIVHVESFSDVIKDVAKAMEGGAAGVIPNNRPLAAQYLLLYSLSLPPGHDLAAQITLDQAATQLTVTMANVSSREIRRFADAAEAWLRDHAPAPMHAKAIGAPVMFTHIAERNMRSMLVGALLALAAISVIMIGALQSVRYGLITLIPNLVPAATAFGLWGYANGQINLGASLVCAMTLGIVVDDTIHFMIRYVRGRRELGLSADEAVRVVFRTVGPALVATSAILAAGFVVLTASAFQFNAAMGALTAITIVCALATDLVMLPALLLMLDRDPGETTP